MVECHTNAYIYAEKTFALCFAAIIFVTAVKKLECCFELVTTFTSSK